MQFQGRTFRGGVRGLVSSSWTDFKKAAAAAAGPFSVASKSADCIFPVPTGSVAGAGAPGMASAARAAVPRGGVSGRAQAAPGGVTGPMGSECRVTNPLGNAPIGNAAPIGRTVLVGRVMSCGLNIPLGCVPGSAGGRRAMFVLGEITGSVTAALLCGEPTGSVRVALPLGKPTGSVRVAFPRGEPTGSVGALRAVLWGEKDGVMVP
mmetsp:Transcript_50940/g.121871  ORF Transcript_50940/g.121871 Transcript_50940/m.121871 type:complete len:207 (+) Transcript_50940:1283-1903(+)